MSIEARVLVAARLGVSILTHNASDSIDDVLDGLERQSVRPGSALVVDNGSEDDTIDRCRGRGVTVHQQSNRGVGSGHATGLERLFDDGSIDYVLVLEHDSVLARTCIQNLVAAIDVLEAQALPVGVIACDTLHPAENAVRLEHEEAVSSPVALSPARRITFNGLLISWDAFARVGSPRSDFFVGQEDSDLFRRLRRAGVPIRIARHAVVAHAGKGRFRRDEGLPASRLGYSTRNTTYRDMHLDGHALRGTVRLGGAVLRVMLRRSDDPVATCDAVRRGFTGRLGPLPAGADGS